jgi:hypothetical protein
MRNYIVCTRKSLPHNMWVSAARKALKINPANHPHTEHIARALAGMAPQPERIAVRTARIDATVQICYS